MLNQAYLRLFRGIPPFDIPYNIVRNNPNDVLILPVSQCDKAHFRG